jgi:hypothetical protein
MNVFPLLSLFAFLLLLLLLPMLFGELIATSLVKLHLSLEAALLLMMAMIVGGLVNIPLKRIAHEWVVPVHPLAVFGLRGLWSEMRRERRETIIAVHLGGCVIPTGLALYEPAPTRGAGRAAMRWWRAADLKFELNTALSVSFTARPSEPTGRCKMSSEVRASDTKVTQRQAMDVGDIPGHQLSIYEEDTDGRSVHSGVSSW